MTIPGDLSGRGTAQSGDEAGGAALAGDARATGRTLGRRGVAAVAVRKVFWTLVERFAANNLLTPMRARSPSRC
jgi:hypothetical protein